MATAKTESVTTGGDAAFNPNDILATLDLQALIQQQVEAELAKQSAHQGNPIVLSEQRSPQAPTPAKYLKHYRCDVSPDIEIICRNYDPDTDRLHGERKGQRMKFRRGHFFATEQHQVDQLEWMMRHPQFDPTDPNRIIGGNPTIYEDDGKDLTKCMYCDEVFIIGSNSYKSHLRATHGVVS